MIKYKRQKTKATTTYIMQGMNGVINGLYYYNVPLNEGILEALDQCEWKTISSSIHSRAYQQYGYAYNYTVRRVAKPCEPIPEFLEPLRMMLTEKCRLEGLELKDDYFNQCIVNNYIPGQGMKRHIDHHVYGDVIGCFTLGSSAPIVFRTGGNILLELYTAPNSLYIMSDEARFANHEMALRKSDMRAGVKVKRGRRISVTFRHVPS